MTEYQDKKMKCSDCPEKFTLTAQAQKFFADKGLAQPKRCPACRQKNKAKHEAKGKPQHKPERRTIKRTPPPADPPRAPRQEKVEMNPTRILEDGTRAWSF